MVASSFRDFLFFTPIRETSSSPTTRLPVHASRTSVYQTVVLDPGQPMSCSAPLEGGTKVFMSPKRLAPSKFGMKVSVPPPEADIYAFALVTFQACEKDRGYLLFVYYFQVLTGEIPFRGVWMLCGRGAAPSKSGERFSHRVASEGRGGCGVS